MNTDAAAVAFPFVILFWIVVFIWAVAMFVFPFIVVSRLNKIVDLLQRLNR